MSILWRYRPYIDLISTLCQFYGDIDPISTLHWFMVISTLYRPPYRPYIKCIGILPPWFTWHIKQSIAASSLHPYLPHTTLQVDILEFTSSLQCLRMKVFPRQSTYRHVIGIVDVGLCRFFLFIIILILPSQFALRLPAQICPESFKVIYLVRLRSACLALTLVQSPKDRQNAPAQDFSTRVSNWN